MKLFLLNNSLIYRGAIIEQSGEKMELKYLLQQAITNIQNLQEYYEHQIEQTELYQNHFIENVNE